VSMIEFQGVSKKFMLHHEKARSFQGALVNLFRNHSSSEQFWALRDVTFGVNEGESLGIIGQNGSGKSTILKLVSRILEPSKGHVSVTGRVLALLELGAGFHPELTGRENVYLNGSILGIPHRQMKEKYQEIVAFSELERFIDTPIKHYSSGMYVRLGFAVAVTLEPDILIVDEVLAVGDEAFRDKCVSKIREFHARGGTILFVSHVTRAIEQVCERVILLDDGEIVDEGDPSEIVERYHDVLALHKHRGLRTHGWQTQQTDAPRLNEAELLLAEDLTDQRTVRQIVIEDVRLLDGSGRVRQTFESGDPATVSISYRIHDPGCQPGFRVGLYRGTGTLVHRTTSSRMGVDVPRVAGTGTIDLDYRELPLIRGSYYLTVEAVQRDDPSLAVYDRQSGVVNFRIETSHRVGGGVVALPHAWRQTLDTVGGNGNCPSEKPQVIRS
jgi:ABC-type polysaccharide/polyol phosphate transport system ATPase subunit